MNNILRRNDFDLFEREDPFFDGLMSIISNDNKKILSADIKENDNDYVIMLDVPGIKKEDIKISLEDKNLIVEATTTKSEEDKKAKYLHRERFIGTYARSFYVGDVKQENIKASFDNGVLSITFPKKVEEEEKEDKYIQIS